MLIIQAKYFLANVKNYLKRQEGQGMVEYGLIIAGIAVIVAVAIFALGPKIRDMFNNIGNEITKSR